MEYIVEVNDDGEWRRVEEGPWDTKAEAVHFAEAEVGLPWRVKKLKPAKVKVKTEEPMVRSYIKGRGVEVVLQRWERGEAVLQLFSGIKGARKCDAIVTFIKATFKVTAETDTEKHGGRSIRISFTGCPADLPDVLESMV